MVECTFKETVITLIVLQLLAQVNKSGEFAKTSDLQKIRMTQGVNNLLQ